MEKAIRFRAIANRSGCPITGNFTIAGTGTLRRRVFSLPQFATVRGGAYFVAKFARVTLLRHPSAELLSRAARFFLAISVSSFQKLASLDGSESGGSLLPAGFFVSFRPATAKLVQRGKRKGKTMTPKNHLNKAMSLRALLAFVLIWFALAQQIRAVSPSPDGCYPAYTTAEGCNALASLGSGLGNTAVGWYSLFLAGDANFNTGIGAGALALTTAAGSDSNTAVGAAAMLLNTSGEENTAVGSNALLYNGSGNGNNAVGAFALHDNIDGNNNNAFGPGALFKNIHASFNTAIGPQALFFNDITGNNTAYFNTAVGASALNQNTDGDSNTAVGSAVLSNNHIATRNTAVGSNALRSNDSTENGLAGDNTGVGVSALGANTDGFLNTAVGADALNSNTTGNDNTAIGWSALTDVDTGGDNTAIGWQAGANLTGGESGNIYVGSGAYGVAGENGVIRIGGNLSGSQACYVRGIAGVNIPAGNTVYIDPVTGRLGDSNVSSKRYKEDIKPMNKASESILALNPVTFRFKKKFDAKGIPQFGLVAEEVAKVNPDLVRLDRDGQPISVRYEAVNAMLLNEFLKEHKKVEEQIRELKNQDTKIQQQEAVITKLKKDVQTLVARLDEQASKLQRVSDQIEMNKAAEQVAAAEQ